MNYILRNKNLSISIDHPLQNYQSSRFDWTGKISEVKFLGLPMTITEKPNGENEHIYGKGLFNEFSMDTALGFEEAKIGGWFHKIGIGLLKKDGPDYNFYKDYEIKPAHFDALLEVNKLTFECISQEMNGYAYVLRKEIILGEDFLQLKYSLENTGKKEIVAEEYVHNFLSIGNALINEEYELSFPFQLDTDKEASIDPDQIINIQESRIKFDGDTENQFFSSYLNGKKIVESQWVLKHTKHKIGLRETATFPTSKVNLWGWKHVISPELFHDISIQAGETEEWSRTYHFFEVD
jgi:hypothetical protein